MVSEQVEFYDPQGGEYISAVQVDLHSNYTAELTVFRGFVGEASRAYLERVVSEPRRAALMQALTSASQPRRTTCSFDSTWNMCRPCPNLQESHYPTL